MRPRTITTVVTPDYVPGMLVTTYTWLCWNEPPEEWVVIHEDTFDKSLLDFYPFRFIQVPVDYPEGPGRFRACTFKFYGFKHGYQTYLDCDILIHGDMSDLFQDNIIFNAMGRPSACAFSTTKEPKLEDCGRYADQEAVEVLNLRMISLPMVHYAGDDKPWKHNGRIKHKVRQWKPIYEEARRTLNYRRSVWTYKKH